MKKKEPLPPAALDPAWLLIVKLKEQDWLARIGRKP